MEWQTVIVVGLGLAAVVALTMTGYGAEVAIPVLTFVGGLATPAPFRKNGDGAPK